MRFTRGHKRSPVVRWMSALKHFLKHGIGIALATGRPQSVLVVHPRKYDDFGFGVKPEKQSKPSPDLGPTPVPECGPHRIALPVVFAVRVARHRLQYQLRQGVEKFDVGVRVEPLRVLGLGTLCGCLKFLQLLDQAVVEQQIPTVSLNHSTTSPSISWLRSTGCLMAANMERARSVGNVDIC